MKKTESNYLKTFSINSRIHYSFLVELSFYPMFIKTYKLLSGISIPVTGKTSFDGTK